MKGLESGFVAIFFVVILLCLAKYHWDRRHLYLFAAKLPGPTAWPIFGSGLKFMFKKKEILDIIVKTTEQYTSPLRIWLGPRLLVYVTDPDQLQIILQSSKISTKAYIYAFLEPFLGKGLFTSSGNEHKKHRKLFQPFFSQRFLEGYTYLFQKHADRLVQNIKNNVDGPEFDILPFLHEGAFEASMDILLEDKNTHSIDYKDVPHYIRRFYDIFFDRVLTFWLHPDFIYKKTSLFKEQEEMSKIAKTMTQELMNTKVPEIVKRLENQKIEQTTEVRPPSVLETLIEMIIEDPNCLTEKECIDHLMTFVATSQDTQSSAIAFTLMMLGMHPEIQEKVYQEVIETVGDRSQIYITDTTKMKFMEMCIKESMRLFPLAPFVFRDTLEDFPLGDKYVIPAGTTVVIAIYSVHRNPKYWEKPTEFYPEHFLPEAVANRHQYAYIPFSAGPRKCIAQQYSYTNMKIMIATILREYYVKSDQKLETFKIITDVSIRPLEGYRLKIEKRLK